jgi:hypothetical protein
VVTFRAKHELRNAQLGHSIAHRSAASVSLKLISDINKRTAIYA